jgi:hypothetical protein
VFAVFRAFTNHRRGTGRYSIPAFDAFVIGHASI